MSICSSGSGRITANMENKRYNGIRRRKWGKWVSEIRVPGTQERLWLGTYATPEAAAVAHDVAFYCLRRPTTLEKLNFPEMLPSYCVRHNDLSPRSVQKAASDAGMAVDAQSIGGNMLMKETDDYSRNNNVGAQTETNGGGFGWQGLGNDDIIDGAGIQGGYEDYIYREGQAFDISVEDHL